MPAQRAYELGRLGGELALRHVERCDPPDVPGAVLRDRGRHGDLHLHCVERNAREAYPQGTATALAAAWTDPARDMEEERLPWGCGIELVTELQATRGWRRRSDRLTQDASPRLWSCSAPLAR